MYDCKSSAMFLGVKKSNFNDTEMYQADFYINNEVDKFYVQGSNPIVNDLQKLKPTQTCTIGVNWIKRDKGWSHRLTSVTI